MCEAGVPFLFNPDGSVFACADPALNDTVNKFLYLSDRLPEYVLYGGYVLGFLVMLLTAVTVFWLLT